jgi:hypothetical protein
MLPPSKEANGNAQGMAFVAGSPLSPCFIPQIPGTTAVWNTASDDYFDPHTRATLDSFSDCSEQTVSNGRSGRARRPLAGVLVCWGQICRSGHD